MGIYYGNGYFVGNTHFMSILIAQKHGAKDDQAISGILRDGLLLALIFVIPAFLLYGI